MKLPKDLVDVHHFVSRYGVAGALQLIANDCRDRAVSKPKDDAEHRVEARVWQQRADIVEAAVEQVRHIEAERSSEDPINPS